MARSHCAAVVESLFCKIHIWFNKMSAVNKAVQALYFCLVGNLNTVYNSHFTEFNLMCQRCLNFVFVYIDQPNIKMAWWW